MFVRICSALFSILLRKTTRESFTTSHFQPARGPCLWLTERHHAILITLKLLCRTSNPFFHHTKSVKLIPFFWIRPLCAFMNTNETCVQRTWLSFSSACDMYTLSICAAPFIAFVRFTVFSYTKAVMTWIYGEQSYAPLSRHLTRSHYNCF